MKKIISLLMALALVASVFCGCGEKTFKCDACGKNKSGKAHTVEALGQKAAVCEDCKKSWDELVDTVGEAVGLEDLKDSLSGIEDSLKEFEDSLGDVDNLDDLGNAIENALGEVDLSGILG